MPILRTGSSWTAGVCACLFGATLWTSGGVANAQVAPGSQITSGGLGAGTSNGVQQGLTVPSVSVGGARRLTVTANAGATYDSNATRTNAIRVTPPGEQKEDVQFPLGLSTDIFLPVGRNTFSLSGYAGYVRSLHNRNLNSENIGLTGGYQRDFHPCTFDLTGGYNRGRTDFAYTSSLSFAKNIQTISSVGGSVTCGPQVGLRPFASVSYSSGRNSQVLRKFNDHDTVTYGGGVVLAHPTLGDIGFLGSISQNDYPDRPITGVNGAQSTNVKNIGVYFKRASARILQATIQVNYTVVDAKPSTRQYHNFSGLVDVQFQPGGRFVFTGTLSRAIVTSLSYNSSYNIETSGFITANAAISARMSASLGYSRTHREYVGVPVTLGHVLTSDNNQQVNGNATYTVTSRMGLDFGISYISRSANDPIYNFNAVRVTAGVRVRLR